MMAVTSSGGRSRFHRRRRQGWVSQSSSTCESQVSSNGKMEEDPAVDEARRALSRRRISFRMFCMLVLAAIPVLGMVVHSSLNLQDAKQQKDAGEAVSNDIFLSTQQGKVVVNVAVERGTTALYVSSGGDSLVHERFPKLYGNTDGAMAALQQYKWPKMSDLPWHFQSLGNLRSYIREHRGRLSVNHTTVEEQLKFYTDINAFFISRLGTTVRKVDTSQVWTNVVAYHMIVMSEEYTGLERAMGSVFYARGGLTVDASLYYNKVKFFGQTCLDLALSYAPDVAAIFQDVYVNSTLEKGIKNMRQKIHVNDVSVDPNVHLGLHWFDNMTSYIGILRRLDEHLSKKILDMVDENVQELDLRLSLNIIILVVVIVVSPLITYGVHKMAYDTQSIACRLQKVELERQKADGILYQIFPKSVADCMKKNNAVAARQFKHVTVMFSDVVGFEDISASLSAHRLVDLLNRLYHTLDSAIDLYDVNKVESTGGAYLIVSGLPTKNGDKHAGEIASLALHFLSAADIFNPLHVCGKIKLRIGIHTGSCVAGVVGYKRPRYHVFGRTVNIAHRLQTSGEAGRIQISAATQQVLEELGGYNMAKRTESPDEVKELFAYEDDDTYWLLGKVLSGRPGMLSRDALVLSYKGI
ncbi:uncharacterized protein LOC144869445 [Branchiostoma floridae x Branchiostoma japonicum]